MIYVASIVLLFSFVLAFVVHTRKIKLPLLFDTGLTLFALGIVALADSIIADKSYNIAGFVLAGSGLVLMMASYVKKTRRYDRTHRGRVVEIDGSVMREIKGGKQ